MTDSEAEIAEIAEVTEVANRVARIIVGFMRANFSPRESVVGIIIALTQIVELENMSAMNICAQITHMMRETMPERFHSDLAGDK